MEMHGGRLLVRGLTWYDHVGDKIRSGVYINDGSIQNAVIQKENKTAFA